MESFVKKIFDGSIDESVKLQFMKFSRGEFKDRALVDARKSRGKFSIAMSYEYANELVKAVAEKIDEGESVLMSGAIISTRNLKEIPEFHNLLAHCKVKQFQGVRKFLIDTEISKEKIFELCEKFPKSFLALSFKVGDSELKIKPKAPKSGKPGKGDKKPKVDFCKLKTTDVNLVKGILFDVGEFKKISINHTFLINEIDIPKDEKDSVLMRERAVRKGKVIRKIEVDGREEEREVEFVI